MTMEFQNQAIDAVLCVSFDRPCGFENWIGICQFVTGAFLSSRDETENQP